MDTQGAIGVFDSGIGGTSIWKEIVLQLPNESTLYLADSAHAPYGSKTKEEIISLSVKNTEKLLDLGSKIIVVACNTATTNAIHHLRASYNVPFIGIEPAIKPAALGSKKGAIGILATRGTLTSKLFTTTSERFASDLKTIEVIGEGLVPIIESGKLDTPELRNLLIQYIQPMLDAQVDHIVLGCSHYPYLIPLLRSLLPPGITIIDSGEAVARQTHHILKEVNALTTNKNPSHRLVTNGSKTILENVVSSFCKTIRPPASITVEFLKF